MGKCFKWVLSILVVCWPKNKKNNKQRQTRGGGVGGGEEGADANSLHLVIDCKLLKQ